MSLATQTYDHVLTGLAGQVAQALRAPWTTIQADKTRLAQRSRAHSSTLLSTIITEIESSVRLDLSGDKPLKPTTLAHRLTMVVVLTVAIDPTIVERLDTDISLEPDEVPIEPLGRSEMLTNQRDLLAEAQTQQDDDLQACVLIDMLTVASAWLCDVETYC